MGLDPQIRLVVPGTLEFRAVAVRVVAEACRLVRREAQSPNPTASPEAGPELDLTHPFDVEVVSAFAEIFNNIAIHAYARRGGGVIEVAVAIAGDEITIELRDTGATFDLAAVREPALDDLPEGGMGLHIARTMLDDMTYLPGPPNVWRLRKRHVALARRSA